MQKVYNPEIQRAERSGPVFTSRLLTEGADRLLCGHDRGGPGDAPRIQWWKQILHRNHLKY